MLAGRGAASIAPGFPYFNQITETTRQPMDLRTVTEQLRTKVGEDSGLGAVLKFDCGADGAIVVDATKVPNTVSNDAATECDCTVALTLDTLSDLLSGNLEPVTGFMTGRFKVSGDMSVAMKLQRVV